MNQSYRQSVIDYIRVNARPADKFGHQPRLYRLAVQVADGKPFDDDVVFAAAWMHDLGVFIGHRPEKLEELANWDMVAYAIKTAPALLESFGFPAHKIPAVLEVIRTHQPAKKPATFEGEIIRDADILEQLGAIGIFRTACKVGRDTRFINFADATRALRRNLETLTGQLRLDSSRRLAEPRANVLRAFLDAAEAEAGECDY